MEVAVGDAPGLGEDQDVAVRMLAGHGGSLRAVLSPAGHGKTTMLHTAARAATGDGRPVVAVATTAKAVAELVGAGLDAKTIARLRIDLANGPLAAGTVVVLDEISQTPTAEVEAVLAAVDACPGGQVWVLGDPRQSQPVGAGGAADHIEWLATAGTIPSARLTVNRRQIDPADREALDLLRRGDSAASQDLRAGQGWEHEHASPTRTREAMAQAICDDIARYGADQVAVLVVSHGDAEDLADRVRARLGETGELTGPSITGPGWTTERDYRAGDRVLLHARCGPSGSPLVNGTTATVTRVDAAGLTVRLDGRAEKVELPAAFVQGTRKDGAPNLSHAWARTVDGAQGGTWEACHLLGSSALDAYRGYTGQSRSKHPTHTWNTKQLVAVDYGGILADQRDAAEAVAHTLARQPDPTLAARSDPWTIDRQVRDLIAEHERVLAGRPVDPHEALAAALEKLRLTEAWLSNMDAVAAYSASQFGSLGILAGLSRRGRQERRDLHDKLTVDRQRADDGKDRGDEIAARVASLQQHQDAFERFEKAEGWRREDLRRLHDQLDDHWARAVAACVRADDPLAFGIDKLRHARATTAARVDQLDAQVPPDRGEEWQQVRRQLPDLIRSRHRSEQAVTASQESLDDARRRRWGRHDHDAIAAAEAKLAFSKQSLEDALTAERDLRDEVAAIAAHQQERREVVNDSAPRRNELASTLVQLDGALDHTRAERVRALADEPPTYQVERLGDPPRSTAGRAVWCHHALPIEAALDRNDGVSPPRTGWRRQDGRTRQEIAVADRQLEANSAATKPTEWAELAKQAGTLREQAIADLRVRRATQKTMSPTHQAGHHLHIDHPVRPPGPELGL